MADILETILTQRRLDVAAAKLKTVEEELTAKCQSDFPEAPLNLRLQLERPGLCVAAEFKRASPSKGAIADEGTPIEATISAYTRGGASILSVLTEPTWFKGSLADLQKARLQAEVVTKEINGVLADSWLVGHCSRPIMLRKDFIVDSYQILEARAWGADTILLIVSALPTVQLLQPLIEYARRLGMEPLVEVNSVEETVVAVASGSLVLGVNNRNLRTFTVDMATTSKVVAYLVNTQHLAAKPTLLLSLSGIKDATDVHHLVEQCTNTQLAGCDSLLESPLKGFLIGEALMRSACPEADVRKLVEAAAHGPYADSFNACCKICGITNQPDALTAAARGSEFVGFIMVESSKRFRGIQDVTLMCAAIRTFREKSADAHLKRLAPPQLFPSSTVTQAAAAFESRGMALRHLLRSVHPLTVGVFMNSPASSVLEKAAAADFDIIQLHGDEDPAEFASSPLPIVKVFHVPSCLDSEEALAKVRKFPTFLVEWSGVASAILLDTTIGVSFAGGSGVPFDHSAVFRELHPLFDSSVRLPVILAGGLSEINVTDILKLTSSTPGPVYVWGADVSSGIEAVGASVPSKSPSRMAAFIDGVHSMQLL